MDIDILSPFGTLLIKAPLADDDIDDSLECPSPLELTEEIADLDEAGMCIEVEDALGELDSMDLNASVTHVGPTEQVFNGKIIIQGVKVLKAWALSRFNQLCKHTGLTDCLKQVRDVSRFVESKMNDQTSEPPADDSKTLVISDPIATLV